MSDPHKKTTPPKRNSPQASSQGGSAQPSPCRSPSEAPIALPSPSSSGRPSPSDGAGRRVLRATAYSPPRTSSPGKGLPRSQSMGAVSEAKTLSHGSSGGGRRVLRATAYSPPSATSPSKGLPRSQSMSAMPMVEAKTGGHADPHGGISESRRVLRATAYSPPSATSPSKGLPRSQSMSAMPMVEAKTGGHADPHGGISESGSSGGARRVLRATAYSPPTAPSLPRSMSTGAVADLAPTAGHAGHPRSHGARSDAGSVATAAHHHRSRSMGAPSTVAESRFSTTESNTAQPFLLSTSFGGEAELLMAGRRGDVGPKGSRSNPLHVWGHEGGLLRMVFGGGKHAQAPRAPVPLQATELNLHEAVAARAPTPPPLKATEEQPAVVATTGSSSQEKEKSKGSDELAIAPPAADYFSLFAGPEGRESGGGGGGGGARQNVRTRNNKALHAFLWDQRVFLPASHGLFSSWFTLFASPRFLEKVDWSVRASILTILPTLILCLEPGSRHIFPLPTSVVSLAYWISMPTLGGGLRETFVVLKGYSLSLVILCIFIGIRPGPNWLSLLLFFIAILIVSFVAEQMRRTCAYCCASLIMQYIRNPADTGYTYVGKYYTTLLIALGFGLAAFFVPYIRWSSDIAVHYLYVMGDCVGLSVRCSCLAFWTRSPLERHLFQARLRQLRAAIDASQRKAATAISESGYEPHSGTYIAQLKTRLNFFGHVSNILQSLSVLLDQVTANPALLETDMCVSFGRAIMPALRRMAATFDRLIQKVADVQQAVTPEDMDLFRQEAKSFEDALAHVREEVILLNPEYKTAEVDVLLGFFLFSVEELITVVGGFKENPKPPNNIIYGLSFFIRDLRSVYDAFVALFMNIYYRHSITRRLKEAIKLALCVTIAAIFQVYAMKNQSTSPVAGVDIIALVYQRTGAESFQYATNRLLGTVLGSLTGLLSVQIANSRRWVLYILTTILTFIGMYVEAAPGFYPLGNAMCNSVISIVIQYKNQNSAMVRIQQNCFAILIYFIISSIIWPMRGRTKMKLGLDMSLRFFRESVARLLRNLDVPDGAPAVSEDVTALLGGMNKRIGIQKQYLNGAGLEPTMDSAEFPTTAWQLVIAAQQRLYVTLLMMRYAFTAFMSSQAGRILSQGGKLEGGGRNAAVLSVHWIVLHRISPYTMQLSEHIWAAVDIYLLGLAKAPLVPTAQLMRLRQMMEQCRRGAIDMYIATIFHEIAGQDSEMSSASASSSSSQDDFSPREKDSNVAQWVQENAPSQLLDQPEADPNLLSVDVNADEDTTSKHDGTKKDGEASPLPIGSSSHTLQALSSGTGSPGVRHHDNNTTKTASSKSSRHSRKAKGRFAYKLTPAEREKLELYLTATMGGGAALRASFFPSMTNITNLTSQAHPSPDTPLPLNEVKRDGAKAATSTPLEPPESKSTVLTNASVFNFATTLQNASFLCDAQRFAALAAAAPPATSLHNVSETATSGADSPLSGGRKKKEKEKEKEKDKEKRETREGEPEADADSSEGPVQHNYTFAGGPKSIVNTFMRNLHGTADGANRSLAMSMNESMLHTMNWSNSSISVAPLPNSSVFLDRTMRLPVTGPVTAGGLAASASAKQSSPMTPGALATTTTTLTLTSEGGTKRNTDPAEPTSELHEGRDGETPSEGPDMFTSNGTFANKNHTTTNNNSNLNFNNNGTFYKNNQSIFNAGKSFFAKHFGKKKSAHRKPQDMSSNEHTEAEEDQMSSRSGGAQSNLSATGHRQAHFGDDTKDNNAGGGGKKGIFKNNQSIFKALNNLAQGYHAKASSLSDDETATRPPRPRVLDEDTLHSSSEEEDPGEKDLLEHLSFYDDQQDAFVLTNRDVHSLEAFLFGIRSLVTQMDDLERNLLETIQAQQMAKEL